MQSSFFSWLMIHVVPYIRFTTYYTSFRGYQYLIGYELLEPGDIILTTDKLKLTSFLIPGEFSHAALCVNKDGHNFEIVEMTHENFHKTWFFDVCKESTRLVILRSKKKLNRSKIIQVIKKALSFERSIYDLQFGLGVKALYCSELIYHAYKKFIKFDLTDVESLGRNYISPGGIYDSDDLKLVFDSDNFKDVKHA